MSHSSLSPNARVWIYQSNRSFTETETKEIQEKLTHFVQQWSAHGRALQAEGLVIYQQFILLLADESLHQASGCSIDSSVHFLKNIEQTYKIQLFNRLLIAYKEGEKVKTVNRNEFVQLLEKGLINEQTIVFNNLVQTKADLDYKWEVPLAQSWHRQLIKNTVK